MTRRRPLPTYRSHLHYLHLVLHLALIAGSVIVLAPFAWMISTSLKHPAELFHYPPIWIPAEIAWDNYRKTLLVMPFGRFYLNSLIVTTSVTVLQLLVSALAAFAFARLRFHGRNMLFLLYLATLMIPFEVRAIPTFILVSALGWYDTYQALIFPSVFSAFSTFLLRQYFLGIPRDFDEAALMDGASSFQIWWQIIMPLSGSVLAALVIFVSLNTWNDFLWPLIITNSLPMRTLPVGLSMFQGQYQVEWHLLMAGSVIAMIPIVLIYIVAQRWFIQGVTLTGMGGR